MKRKLNYMLVLFFFTLKIFGQCEVKSLKISDNYTRYSMGEQFSKNADLENGIKATYVYTNSFKDILSKKVILNSIVVTYLFSSYQPEFTPGKLLINLSDGASVTIIANKKSTNTFNEFVTAPSSIKTIEGIFELTSTDVTSIIGTTISSILIFDNRQGTSMDITPTYKGILSEMIKCVTQ